MFGMHSIICGGLITLIVLLQSANVGTVTFGLRLRRAEPIVDVSLKTPVLNALTERTAVDATWEHCMIVAPMTIQLLGQLLIVASTKDVSFRAFAPDRKFTYIRNPESFRATLLQVSHEGYQAFLSGHSTMNVIQLRMVQIPKHIKTALKLLGGKYPQRVLKRLLPQLLNNIEETGDECVTLTNTTKNEFSRVMLLVDEVIETTAATQSAHETLVEANERELAVLRKMQEGLAEEKQFRAQRYKEATEGAKRADEIYTQALKDIPTGWDAVMKDFARGILKVGTTLAEAYAAVKVGPAGLLGARSSSNDNITGARSNTGASSDVADARPLSFGLSQTLTMANEFANSLRTFKEAVSSKNMDIKLIDNIGISFKAFLDFITGLPDNPAKTKVIKLIERGQGLVSKTAANAKLIKSSNETVKEVIKELQELFDQLESFQSANQYADPKTTTNTLSTLGKNTGHGAATDSSQNEVLKAQIAQTQLIEMRRREDAQAEEYLKLIENIHKTSTKIMSIDLATISYKEIIEMLREAFNLLAQVRIQWHNFVLFFTNMSAHISNMIKGPLKRFLQVAAVGDDLEHTLRMDLIDTLKDDTFGIHREAYILFVMSRTYYEVSSKYLMGRLAGLSSMLVARKETERSALMLSLQNQTNQTLTEIKALILERKTTFDKELNTRNAELVTLIDQLGGPNKKAQRAIKEGKKMIAADAEWGDD